MKYYKIYRNLHKNCFSVLKYNAEKKGYRLHAHVDDAILYGVKTKVSEAGRNRVRKEKSKNVHAFIFAVDFEITDRIHINSLPDELYYNPYTTEQFINKTTGLDVLSCSKVMLRNCKAYILEN